MPREAGALGETQRFYLRSEVMAARHAAFTSRVLSALRAHDVAAAVHGAARGAAGRRARRCIARWRAPSGGRACRATG